MFKTVSEAVNFVKEVESKLQLQTNTIAGVAVPFTALSEVKKVAKKLVIAAQNVHFEENGAFTGEISIPMLKDLGIEYVVIGHSERREMFGETDQTVNKKAKALLKNKMVPVLCCGESLETYEKGLTNSFVKDQIIKGFEGIRKVATPQIAQDVCHSIREVFVEIYGKEIANEISIQYGGSVKPENIKEIMSQSDIDGALVGGASLETENMDGTAYHHLGEVIEENIEPLIEAQKKGVIVSFVTGRPVFAPHNKIIEHGFAEHGPSIIAACNGGVIYDIKNQKILQDNSIPKEIVKKLFELLEKPKNKDVEVFAYSNDFNIAYINKSFEESKFMEIEKKFFEHEYKIVNSKSDLLPCFKFLVFNFSQEFEKDLLDLGLEI
ncbi:hypothetical protein FQR65_LT16462 [Abscondita terminalis]|nr:hypothetical protein FQR65_LT16462 [Abscondita terminalis]